MIIKYIKQVSIHYYPVLDTTLDYHIFIDFFYILNMQLFHEEQDLFKVMNNLLEQRHLNLQFHRDYIFYNIL